MDTRRISAEKRALIVKLWIQDGIRSERKISRLAQVHWKSTRRVLRAEGLKVGPFVPSEGKPAGPAAQPEADAPSPDSSHKFTREESSDASRIEFTSDKRIRTLEDAIAYAEVDTTIWRVDRWETTSWEVTLKAKHYDDKGKVTHESPVRKTMWRVKMFLKRILPKALQDATEAILERMKGHEPRYATPRRMPSHRRYLLDLGLVDTHFGKLAWAPETGGHNYDLKIAERVYQNAIEDLLAISSGFAPSLIVITIGSDTFHVDGQKSMTTGGTYVDSDGRHSKIIEAVEMAVVKGIDTALAISPVKVVWIPGNHDRITSYHLARTLSAWYRNCRDVEVDCGPASRKYLRWGTNLIGYVHGDTIKPDQLPLLMATERPQDWAETTCREWRTGHLHHSRRFVSQTVNSKMGVGITTLPSLAGTDAWHHDMSFVGTQNAAEAYIMDFEAGQIGHFVSRARVG